MKKTIITFLLAAVATFAADFEAEIFVDGKPIKEFKHAEKRFVEGKQGSAFTLKLKNNTGARALFVSSIDGLNIIDGEKAKAEGEGYVIPAYTTQEISGWRTSLEEVRKFVFADKSSGQTYSEKTGNGTENCGVIGVKVFKEKVSVVNMWPWRFQIDTKAGFPTTNYGAITVTPGSLTDTIVTVPANANYSTVTSTSGANVNVNTGFDLGTKMGEAQKSRAQEVAFERGDLAPEISIYYASMAGLVSLGVDVYPKAFAKVFCKPVD